MARPNQSDLTERHLALHQKSYTSEDPKFQTTWAEQVVREESIQAFHAQSGMLHVSGHGSLTQTENLFHQPDRATDELTSAPQQLDNNLKLFNPVGTEHIDDPVKRFLTPGSSDPSLFAKPALRELDISFGSMETVETREQMARANVDAVRENRKKYKGGEIQQKIDEEASRRK